MSITFIMLMIFGAAMFMAAWKDLTTYTIPNWISLFVLGGFCVIAPFAGMSLADFGIHLLVGLGAFAIMIAMFAMRWLGGGDAKLFAATAIWWMPADLLMYTVYTCIFGGVLAIAILATRNLLPAKIRTTGWVHTLLRDEKKMPYGLALAPAALLTLPQSAIFASAALG